MSVYCVEFERIGRNHSVAPIEVEAATGEGLASSIYVFGRRYLMSRDVEVEVDLESGTGRFVCGGLRTGGQFKFGLVEDGAR